MRRHFRWSSLPELPEACRQEAGGLAHFTTVGLDSVQMAGWDSATLLEAVKEGRVGAKPKAWRDMTLGDETVVLEYRGSVGDPPQ